MFSTKFIANIMCSKKVFVHLVYALLRNKKHKFQNFLVSRIKIETKIKQNCSYQGEALTVPTDCLLRFMEQ